MVIKLIRSIGAILMVLGLFSPGLTTPASAAPVPVNHNLSVILDPENQKLSGIDMLKLDAAGMQNCFLSINPGARIVSVSLAKKTVPYTFNDGKLQVLLPDQVRHGQIELAVSYEGFFRDAVPVNPVQTEDPGFGVTGVICADGAFLLSEAGWYPDLTNSRPTFRISVQVPAGWEAVTAGRRVIQEAGGKMTTSVWQITHPSRGISLSAGPYVVREEAVEGVPLYTYFFSEDDHLAGGYLKAAAGYLRLYSDLFGPYPFEKFAVVENFFPTGYGFASYTLLGRTVVRLPFIIETSLGHEVAHSWWGNGVLVDYEHGNWSEGLTTYVADYLYEERSSAEKGRAYRLKVMRDYATLVAPEEDFALQFFAGRFSPATRSVGYGKAAIVFHMARRMVGDQAFWAGLRKIIRQKMFQKASWDDFAVALEEESGQECKAFFHQWVSRPGAPELSLRGVTAEQDGQGWRVSGRVAQKSPYYDLKACVRLETEGEHIDSQILLTGAEAAFTLQSGARPRTLVVDPDVDLFRRLDPSEIPSVINGIKGSESLVAVIARSAPGGVEEASGPLFEALGQKGAPVLQEGDISLSHLRGHDVLYVGLPEGKAYLPPLPEGVGLSAAGFTIEGEAYQSPGDVLFIVLPHPQEAHRVAAVFLPLSAGAVPAAVRKVPHYGKYSYLVFRDGENQVKGTWPVSASPLIHVFSIKEDSK